MRTLRTPFWTSLGWITLLTGAGCNLRALTAESTADLLHAAAPQFDTLEDLDFAEAAAPANLVTMESVYRVVPRNQDVLIELTKGLTGYAFAFLENHMEQARVDDHPETEESFRLRAKGTYRRAKTFGFELLDVRAQVPGGPDGRVRAGLDAFRTYLRRFNSRDDVPALFWTGNAWLSYIQLSLDDPGALLDLPYAMALIERARALDPEFYHGGIHLVYGLYYTGTPRELGGRPDLAQQEFQAAIGATHGHLLINQVMYAKTYAVQTQNRVLFRRLLEEVLAAGDVMPSERLVNQVAKRRAQRYLAQIDELFAPDEPQQGSTPAAPSSSSIPQN